jgi:hypothetical protein
LDSFTDLSPVLSVVLGSVDVVDSPVQKGYERSDILKISGSEVGDFETCPAESPVFLYMRRFGFGSRLRIGKSGMARDSTAEKAESRLFDARGFREQ